MADKPLALVAMGRTARHRTAFNSNAHSHGMIHADMTFDCDAYIPNFVWNRDFRDIPHQLSTGDHPSIIVSVIGHRRFEDLCHDFVYRFLMPNGEHRHERVIVMMDDLGMRISWVVCEYLKDLLNSIMFGGNRVFNVETFLFYKECERHADASRGYDMFCNAREWVSQPSYLCESRPVQAQYGRRHVFELRPEDPRYTTAIHNVCQVSELIAHHFSARDGDGWPADGDEEPAEEAPPAATGTSSGYAGEPSEEPDGGDMEQMSDGHQWDEWDQASDEYAFEDPNRSSDWDIASQRGAIAESMGTGYEAQDGETSPDERPNFARVVNTEVDPNDSWSTWNQRRNQRGNHDTLGAATHGHRDGGGGGDHRTHGARAGGFGGTDDAHAGKWDPDHRGHRETYAAPKSGSHAQGSDASRDAIVKERRREAFSVLQNRAEWRTFAMDITVWDWTLRRLDADGEALRRLKELSEKRSMGWLLAI